ncbi:MAG: diguanylate cyclase [Steroidobacteraceae bacterium]
MICNFAVRSPSSWVPRHGERARLSFLGILVLVTPVVAAVAIAGRLYAPPPPFDIVIAIAASVSMAMLAKWLRDAQAYGAQRLEESVRLADAVPDALLVVRLDGPIILANARVEEFFGHGPDEVLGRHVDELVPGTLDVARRLTRDRPARIVSAPAKGSDQAFQAVRKDGRNLPIDIGFSSMRLGKERVVICVLRDATEAQRARDALLCANSDLARGLAALEERAQAMQQLEQASEFLQCSLMEGEVHQLVAEWAHTFAPETRGALLLLMPSRTEAEAVAVWGDKSNWPAALVARLSRDECWALRRGRVHHSLPGRLAGGCRHHAVQSGNTALCIPLLGQGEPMGVLVVEGPEWALQQPRTQMLHALADRAAAALANLRLHEALKAQSIRDSLTGLYNRRFFEEALEREIGRVKRDGTMLAAMMIDFDHFKRLNDTYGHQAGDAVLRAVGGVLMRELRTTDVASRVGGEEIAVLMPTTDAAGALAAAGQIRARIQQMQVAHGQVVLPSLTISIGIASAPLDANDGASLMARADEALYRAKRAGRNCVVLCNPPAGTQAVANA